MVWNNERVESLKILWKEGYSASEVAKRLGDGISRNAVIGKIHRLGLPSRQTLSSRRSPAAPKALRPLKNKSLRNARASQKAAALTPPSEENQVTLQQLTHSSCRWPLETKAEGVAARFCGAPRKKDSDSPYCEYHAQKAYQRGSRAASGASAASGESQAG